MSFNLNDLLDVDITPNECVSVIEYLNTVEEDYRRYKVVLNAKIEMHNAMCSNPDCIYGEQLKEESRLLDKGKSNLISFRSKLNYLIKTNAEEDNEQ
jgi:hypothetical protein